MNPPDDSGEGPAEAPQPPRTPRGPRGLIGGTEAATITVERPEDLDEPMPAKYSEDQAALKFTARYSDQFRYVAAWGKWLEWDGAKWSADVILKVFDLVRKVCREMADEAGRDQMLTDHQKMKIASVYGTSKVVAAVEKLAKSDPRHASRPADWDKDLWLVNTPGGVVNLRNGEIRPARQSDHMTKTTSVAPSEEAHCPNWHKFLDSVTGGDHELKHFLQRVAGYSLTGSIKEHALFFLYGTGRNGKGTFIGALQGILADYSVVASMNVFIEQKFAQHTTDVAALMGARLVTAQETDEGRRWAESRIKEMTGGDLITARYMRQDNFTFKPQFKLIIAGNHKPGLRNVDEAIKARMNLIPFTVTIPPEQRDKDLPEKLAQEAAGIFRWMIDGCLDWQERGLAQPECVLSATDQYLADQDVMLDWIDSECEQNPNYREKSTDLYASYKKFTERASDYVLPVRAWKAKLESRNFGSVKSHGIHMILGVRLKIAPSFAQSDER